MTSSTHTLARADSTLLTIAGVGAAALGIWALASRQAEAAMPVAYQLPPEWTPAEIEDADTGAAMRFAQTIADAVAIAAPFLPTGADYADALPGSPLYDGAVYAAQTASPAPEPWDVWSSDDAEVFDSDWISDGGVIIPPGGARPYYGDGYADPGGVYRTAGDTARVVGANVGAFLAVIRAAEGTADENGYRALFGYHPQRNPDKVFDDFADHPRVRVKLPNGRTTSAAGAYQMQAGTWDDAKRARGLPDFSPESQDRAAVWIIDKRRRALGDILAGRFPIAIEKLKPEWEAFQKISLERLMRSFLAFGGQTEGAAVFASYGGDVSDPGLLYA